MLRKYNTPPGMLWGGKNCRKNRKACRTLALVVSAACTMSAGIPGMALAAEEDGYEIVDVQEEPDAGTLNTQEDAATKEEAGTDSGFSQDMDLNSGVQSDSSVQSETSSEPADSATTSLSSDTLDEYAVEEYNATWQFTNNHWYYVNSNGKKLTGWQYLSWSGGKNWFYFDGSGVMKTGWQYLSWSGGKNWFYFDGNGVMKTGWQYLSWSGGKNWFYFDGNGAMLTGWQQLKWSGGTSWFYFDRNGAMAANTTVDGYKVDSNGARIGSASSTASTANKVANGWIKKSGSWYYYKNGKVLSGWQYLGWSGGNNWFYFDSNGVMKTGWQYLSWSGGRNWFFFDGNGAMKTGWQYLSWSGGRNWFYFNGSGAMLTGWQQLKWSGGTSWFYFDRNGAMAANTTVDGYKVDSNGARVSSGANGNRDMSAWAASNIKQIYYSSFVHGDKPAKYQKYIVLHDTEGDGSPASVAYMWGNGGRSSNNGIAAHFVVGKDGSIVQCVPMDKIAHHAGYGDNGNNAKYGVYEDGRDSGKPSVYNRNITCYGMNSWSIGIELVHRGNKAYPEAQLKALDNLIAYIDSYYGFQSTIIDHKMWRKSNSDTSSAFSKYLANYRDHRTHN